MASDRRSRGRKFESQLCHTTFVEIDHEMISSVILPLPLILERQLSITGEICVQVLVNCLERTTPAQEKCELVNWLAWHDRNSVDWAIKLQLKYKITLPDALTSHDCLYIKSFDDKSLCHIFNMFFLFFWEIFWEFFFQNVCWHFYPALFSVNSHNKNYCGEIKFSELSTKIITLPGTLWQWTFCLFDEQDDLFWSCKNLHFCVMIKAKVLKFRTPKFLRKWHLQTVQTQIRLLIWSGSTRFAIPQSILSNSCMKSEFRPKNFE